MSVPWTNLKLHGWLDDSPRSGDVYQKFWAFQSPGPTAMKPIPWAQQSLHQGRFWNLLGFGELLGLGPCCYAITMEKPFISKSKSYGPVVQRFVVYHWIALAPRFYICWDITRLNWRVLPITQRFCCIYAGGTHLPCSKRKGLRESRGPNLCQN